MRKGKGPARRIAAKTAAVVCAAGMLFACTGCSINDFSSFFREHTNEMQRKAKEVPRDPDFSPVIESGG